MGQAAQPAPLQAYLGELDGWIRGRKTELDDLDASGPRRPAGAPRSRADMALSLAIWKAVSDRYQVLWTTWDGGRVLQAEREKITSLIWSRLDGATAWPCPRPAGSPTRSPASCAPSSR